MILKLKNKVITIFSRVHRSIAFLPTLLILSFLGFALLLIQIENHEIGQWISGKLDTVIIKNSDTARAILTTIIGGLFSLVVFSFSMVMLLLSQASTSFSPRLLPGLISNKQHQFILGVFIGTIVFGLVTIINILPDSRGYGVPGMAVFISLLQSIASLGLFIYFLHSISQSIQINHILDRLYLESRQQLKDEIDPAEDAVKEQDTSQWNRIQGVKTGYLQSVDEKRVLNLAQNYSSRVHVLIPQGQFVTTGDSVVLSEKKLNEEQEEEILSCLQFDTEEMIDLNMDKGIQQITEIVVKAMSPGINDPKTAISGIDYLGDLFRLRLQLPDKKTIFDLDQEMEIYICNLSFESLLYATMSSIRTYVKHDPQVVLRLLRLIRIIMNAPELTPDRALIVKSELNALKEDALSAIENKRDRQKIQEAVSELETRS